MSAALTFSAGALKSGSPSRTTRSGGGVKAGLASACDVEDASCESIFFCSPFRMLETRSATVRLARARSSAVTGGSGAIVSVRGMSASGASSTTCGASDIVSIGAS